MEIYYKFPILCAYPHLHFSWLKFTNWVVILSSLVIVKVKVLRIAGHWGPEGEERYCYTLSWPRHLDGGGGGQHHAPAALPPRKTRYPLYRRLGGPQGRSGRVRKISPTPTGILSADRPARSGVALPTALSRPLFVSYYFVEMRML